MLRFVENSYPNRINDNQLRMKANSFVKHNNQMIYKVLWQNKAVSYPEYADLRQQMMIHLYKVYIENPNQQSSYYFIAMKNFLRSTMWRMQQIEHSNITDINFISTESEIGLDNSTITIGDTLKSESFVKQIDAKLDIAKKEKYLSDRTKNVLIMSYLSPENKGKKNSKYSRARRDIRKTLEISNKQMKVIQNETENAFKNFSKKVINDSNFISNFIAEEIC